jgi:glyoxylase-like metal-dependent hydrolase (beta-lactamase superfamily II)
VVITVPGRTAGSIALHLPEQGVLITGDTVGEHEGGVVLGPFNVDRAQAWMSLQRLRH